MIVADPQHPFLCIVANEMRSRFGEEESCILWPSCLKIPEHNATGKVVVVKCGSGATIDSAIEEVLEALTKPQEAA